VYTVLMLECIPFQLQLRESFLSFHLDWHCCSASAEEIGAGHIGPGTGKY
jgi:hypothetical protein